MSFRTHACGLAVAAMMSLSACRPVVNPTELVVLVDTDIPLGPRLSMGVPADGDALIEDNEIREISFEIECVEREDQPPCNVRGMGPLLASAAVQDYRLRASSTAPPFYFVLSSTRDVPRTFRVRATVRLGPSFDDTSFVVEREATLVPGETRYVTLALLETCWEAWCVPGQPCRNPCGEGLTCGVSLGTATACGVPIVQTTPPLSWPGSCDRVEVLPGDPRACAENMYRE